MEHCSFNAMKNNRMSNFSLVPKVYMDPDTSPFLRKGEEARLGGRRETSCEVMSVESESRAIVCVL